MAAEDAVNTLLLIPLVEMISWTSCLVKPQIRSQISNLRLNPFFVSNILVEQLKFYKFYLLCFKLCMDLNMASLETKPTTRFGTTIKLDGSNYPLWA